jgi:hypothetical protein
MVSEDCMEITLHQNFLKSAICNLNGITSIWLLFLQLVENCRKLELSLYTQFIVKIKWYYYLLKIIRHKYSMIYDLLAWSNTKILLIFNRWITYPFGNKMKNKTKSKKYHTVGTIPKSNIKIILKRQNLFPKHNAVFMSYYLKKIINIILFIVFNFLYLFPPVYKVRVTSPSMNYLSCFILKIKQTFCDGLYSYT